MKVDRCKCFFAQVVVLPGSVRQYFGPFQFPYANSYLKGPHIFYIFAFSKPKKAAVRLLFGTKIKKKHFGF